MPIIDCLFAQDLRRQGDLDSAIDLSRAAANELLSDGSVMWSPLATNALVESLAAARRRP